MLTDYFEANDLKDLQQWDTFFPLIYDYIISIFYLSILKRKEEKQTGQFFLSENK